MNENNIQISKILLMTAMVALCLASQTIAQSSKSILKQAEKELGGTKALQSIRSVTKNGRITRIEDGVTGKYLYQSSQPNLFNRSFDLDGFEIESGFNGRSGWARNSRDGLQTLTGVASIEMQAVAGFRNSLWMNAKNEKLRIVSGSQTTINGKTANTVVMITPKGVNIKMFFDAATGLPIRDEISLGDSSEICDYADYRDVAGTKQAYFNRLKLGGDTYEITFDEIQINSQIARTEFDFPNLFGTTLPDIQMLLKELQLNEDKVDNILDSYSYSQKIIFRELGKDGVLREISSTTQQLSFYKGYRISRTIEKNGKPLSQKDQEEADKDAARQVAEIEKKIAKENARIAKQGANSVSSDVDKRISIAEVLRASKLSNPRREHFRGRDVIVFDFEPNPAFDLKNAKSMIKILGKSTGVMWVDEKDKQVARIEAVLFESIGIGGGFLAKLNKGATFTLEKERVGDEIWLPSQADYNIAVRVLLIKGFVINQLVKSYDYRKFETEVKGAKFDETKKP